MSDADVEIRRAGPGDARAVGALWIESAQAHAALDPRYYEVPGGAAAAERAERELADEALVVLVAVTAARVVGACWLRRVPPPTPGGMVRDHAAVSIGLVVSTEHRSRGIGRALMEAAEQRAAADGFELMVLDVRRDNEAAIQLYDSLGFQPVGLVMSRWLS